MYPNAFRAQPAVSSYEAGSKTKSQIISSSLYLVHYSMKFDRALEYLLLVRNSFANRCSDLEQKDPLVSI